MSQTEAIRAQQVIAAKAMGGAQKTAPEGTLNGKSTFSSLQDLKERAPKVFNMMLMGVAMAMVSSMKKGQDRVKKAMRKLRDDS